MRTPTNLNILFLGIGGFLGSMIGGFLRSLPVHAQAAPPNRGQSIVGPLNVTATDGKIICTIDRDANGTVLRLFDETGKQAGTISSNALGTDLLFSKGLTIPLSIPQ